MLKRNIGVVVVRILLFACFARPDLQVGRVVPATPEPHAVP